MSRMALLLLAGAPAAAEQPLTAEQALNNYRSALKPTAELDCPRGNEPDEIIVCGARDESRLYRVPYVPEPGKRIAGEPVPAVSLTREEACTNIGQSRGCGHVDLLGIALGIAKNRRKGADRGGIGA